jgi:hypothetical protein
MLRGSTLAFVSRFEGRRKQNILSGHKKPRQKSKTCRFAGPNNRLPKSSSIDGACHWLYLFVARLSLPKCGENILSTTEKLALLLRLPSAVAASDSSVITSESRVIGVRGARPPCRGRFRGRHKLVGNVSLSGLDVVPLVAVLSLALLPDSVTSTRERLTRLAGSPLL